MRIGVFLNRYRSKLLISFVLVIVVLLICTVCWLYGTGFRSKTLWDWMGLLIIPAVLASGVLFFNWAGQKGESQRALDRQCQETLINYFDQMQDLIIKHNLRGSEESSEVRIVARARTVSALRNLDGQSIAQLLQFLTEADLGGNKLLPHINLYQVNLQEMQLPEVDLQGACLRLANLQRADLSQAKLQGAKIWDAYLQSASLEKANLQEADLWGANLQMANLKEANLQGAKITPKQLRKVKSLEAAIMPDGSKYEEWVAKGRPDWGEK